MCMWEKTSPMAQDSRSALIQSHYFCTPYITIKLATQKTRVGMYSGCDYLYKSCLCTLIMPSLLHPSILFNCSIVFILISVLFFIGLSVIYQCHLTWFVYSTLNGPSIEDGRCRSSRVCAKFVATPLTP